MTQEMALRCQSENNNSMVKIPVPFGHVFVDKVTDEIDKEEAVERREDEAMLAPITG